MTLLVPPWVTQPPCVAFVPGGRGKGERCHRCHNAPADHLLRRVETYHPSGPFLLASTVVSVKS